MHHGRGDRLMRDEIEKNLNDERQQHDARSVDPGRFLRDERDEGARFKDLREARDERADDERDPRRLEELHEDTEGNTCDCVHKKERKKG